MKYPDFVTKCFWSENISNVEILNFNSSVLKLFNPSVLKLFSS